MSVIQRWKILMFFALAGLPSGATASEGRVLWRSSTIEGDARPVRYLVYVPASYARIGQDHPLLVGFHGTAGTPEQILQIPGLVQLAEEHGFLVVCPATSGWYGRGFWSGRPRPLSVRSDLHVADVLDRTLAEFRVDPERVYVLGVSKGGAGAWHWAFREPGRWAGVAAISPATYSPRQPWARIASIPAIVIQGAEDRAVSVSANRRLARTMKELGGTHRYVELPGVGHDLSKVDVAGEVFRFFLQVETVP
ncbi:MAG: PHB depolymerase family esterase [Acidobacteriota bacterium]